MVRPTRYLLIADAQDDVLPLQAALAGAPGQRPAGLAGRPQVGPVQIIWAGSLGDAAAVLRQGGIAALLLDVSSSACRTGEALQLLSQTAPQTPLILLADGDNLPAALDAVRHGAHDYFVKPAHDDDTFRQRLAFSLERFAATRAAEGPPRKSTAAQTPFESLVQDSGDAMLVLDLRGHILFANPAAASLLKRSHAKLIGNHAGIPVDNGEAMEVVVGRQRGKDTVADLRLARTTWNGEPAVLATLRDISLRKRTERALLLAKQQAELASEMKSKFLANMSHELRTPLNSILGFAEMMQSGVFGQIGNARYEDYLATIRHSGHHLLTLINNLLDLSKIEAGREELDETVVDIHELLQTAMQAEEATAREHGVTLRCETIGPSRLLRADPVKLDQIVLNLLSNAVKFTPEGGQVILSGEVTPAGGYRIAVADTGCGMDEAEIPQAMGVYSQLRSPFARNRNRGTGLGLPIARGLAELHGGTLEIASRRGFGTRVSVTLPPERVLDETPPAMPSFHAGPTPAKLDATSQKR